MRLQPRTGGALQCLGTLTSAPRCLDSGAPPTGTRAKPRGRSSRPTTSLPRERADRARRARPCAPSATRCGRTCYAPQACGAAAGRADQQTRPSPAARSSVRAPVSRCRLRVRGGVQQAGAAQARLPRDERGRDVGPVLRAGAAPRTQAREARRRVGRGQGALSVEPGLPDELRGASRRGSNPRRASTLGAACPVRLTPSGPGSGQHMGIARGECLSKRLGSSCSCPPREFNARWKRQARAAPRQPPLAAAPPRPLPQKAASPRSRATALPPPGSRFGRSRSRTSRA